MIKTTVLQYGTLYGGAPSPGPAPKSDFLPPGFVPPTPPATTSSRKVLKLTQTRLLASLSEESPEPTTDNLS